MLTKINTNRSCVTGSHRRQRVERGTCRAAFTLVELLVVMGILGFLVSMLTYALLGAQSDARAARTRGTITKLNDIILTQWEEYRYRPVDVRLESFRLFNQSANLPPGVQPTVPLPQMQAHLRMQVLRDTMRMEMPDRVSDLLFEPSYYVSPGYLVPESVEDAALRAGFTNAYLSQRAYPHRFGNIYGALFQAISNSPHPEIDQLRQTAPLLPPSELPSSGIAPLTGQPRSHFPDGQGIDARQALDRIKQWNKHIQSSELLYLIIANSTYGGSSALEYFRPSEIGDTDEDGLLEFIDAWGNAIHWIRWPAGYPSDLNRYSGTDAMDPQRTDWRYRSSDWPESQQPKTVIPLIVSAGADGNFGVVFDHDDFAEPGQSINSLPIAYALMPQGSRFYIDPFFTWDYANSVPNGASSHPPFTENDPNDRDSSNNHRGFRANQMGATPTHVLGIANEAPTDNITNHDIILGQ
ncbi:MAG: type II secretion system protein [Pirellulaceae bacterium]|nr:type II secretion system protein [Pirellulaceae bacterium]